MSRSLVRHIVCTVCVLAPLPSAAAAQSIGASPYVFGGWSLQVRGGTALNGVTFGGGVPLTATVSAEGSVGWYSSKSADASFITPFGFQERHSTDLDVPFAAAIRWSMQCAGRVCADLVGGAGVNFHMVTTRIIVSCPAPGMFVPCVASDRVDEGSHAEFLMAGGVDVKVRLNGQFAVVPGVRVGLPVRTAVPAIFPGRGVAEETPYWLVNVTAFYRF